MACPDGVRELSSEKPASEGVVPELPEEEVPPPPPPEPEEEIVEEYEEEELVPEERPRPRRKKHYGIFIVLVVVLVILLVWTLLSPKVMPQTGDTYITSPAYANLGNYTGDRDIWAGKMTWGLAVSGPESVARNQSFDIMVLITKVYEKPGNSWLRGTSISVQNISLFLDDGTLLATTHDGTDRGFGVSANLTLSFAQRDTYTIYVYAKFLVYEMMRIGFIPLESVEITEAYLDVGIQVS